MQPSSRLRLAALIVAQFVAMWAAFAVLAQTIDWPQSLRSPPAVMLPLITQHASAVAAGYSAYLLHALLLMPIALLLPRVLPGTSRFSTAILLTGSAAAIFKVLGIARWLVLMPVLARGYGAAGDDTGRAMIATVYEALNAYIGGVGELFGVGLFSGVFTTLVAAELYAAGSKRMGSAGFVAAALLLATMPGAMGISVGPLLTVSGMVWQAWLIALAGTLVVSARRGDLALPQVGQRHTLQA